MIVIKHRKSSDVVLLRIDASQLDDRDLTGAYLLGAAMAGLRARGILLREANLRNADLRAADLRGADLRGAVLRGADLRGADLSGVSLADADLRAADLRGADLRGADLSRAMLFEADLAEIRCDLATQWPAGDAWGVVARPAMQPETLWERAGVHPYYLSAQRQALQWRVAYAASSSRRPNLLTPNSVAGRLAGAVLTVALMVAAAWSLDTNYGVRAKRRLDGAPTLATRSPVEAPVSTAPVAPRRPATTARKSHPPVLSGHRASVPKQMALRKPLPAQVRVAQAVPLGQEHMSRGEGHRTTRTVVFVTRHRSGGEARYGRGGSTGGNSSNVRLAAYTSQRVRPRASVRPVAAEAPPAAEQPTEERVAVVPVRPQSRVGLRPAKVQEAWGNSEFHYGSGYDIYTMHLGRRSE
jgi:hypothetical protein